MRPTCLKTLPCDGHASDSAFSPVSADAGASLPSRFCAIESNRSWRSFESSVAPSLSRACCISEGLGGAAGVGSGATTAGFTPLAMLSNKASSSLESPDVFALLILGTHFVEYFLQLLSQRCRRKRFDDVAVGACLRSRDDVLFLGLGGNHHHRQVGQ